MSDPEKAWALRLFDRSILKQAKHRAIVALLGDTHGKECLDLGSDNGVIVARQDFTNGMVNTLTTGADNLTVADPNEEGANMLALQTRQQLGIAALGLSSQSQQAILKLF